MTAAKPIIVPGHRLIEPLQQGELDALCGLYAIINAFRLAYAPVRPIRAPEANRLFTEGIAHLGGRKGLLGKTTTTGMTLKQQAKLAALLGRTMSEALDRPVSIMRLETKPQTFATLIASAIKDGCPVCALFDGALDHYTVISGVSEMRFMLFDSSGLSWVRRSGCQLSSGRKQARHRLKQKSVFSVEVSE